MGAKPGSPNLWFVVIGVIGFILVAVMAYAGIKANADAQIRVAQETANAEITAVWMQAHGPIYATPTVKARSTQAALTIASATLPGSILAGGATATIEATPTNPHSSAVLVMNDYFDWINNAGSKADLIKSWNLETSGKDGFQCTEAAGCEFANFQTYWWQWKVQYKLWDCGSNIIDTEQQRTARDPRLAATPTAVTYVRYHLVDDQGQLKLDSVRPIDRPGEDCKLRISVP